MAYTVLIHIANQEAILAEMDELPESNAAFITCSNPRMKDGKPVNYIDAEATKFLFPWSRISFLEVYPSEEDQTDIETFFRD